MTKHKEKQKKTGFALLNSVLIAAFFLGGGIIFLLATAGITEMLFLPSFIVNAALGILYGIYRKNGAMKVPVIICRVLAIVMVTSCSAHPLSALISRTIKLCIRLKERFSDTVSVPEMTGEKFCPTNCLRNVMNISSVQNFVC
jgi:hypothetical protein